MDEITLIKLSDIVPHPLQERVYGTAEPDDDLVASIAAHGVLQPVIVAANARPSADLDNPVELTDGYDEYMMVSGHRRVRAAERAGLTIVPAIVKDYLTVVDLEIEFLASNIHREKSEVQKNAEFSRWKSVAVFIGKLKKNITVGAFNLTNNCKLNETEFETLKDRHVGLLRQFGFDVSDEFRATQFIESVTGISEHEQRLRTVVSSDEYREGVYVRLRRAGAGESAIGALGDRWNAVRTGYESGALKLATAEKQIRMLVSSFEKSLSPKQKAKRAPKAAPKPTAYIAGAVSDAPDHRAAFAEAKTRLSSRFQVVSPVDLVDANPDVADGDWAACMEFLLPEMAKCRTLILLPGWEASRGARIERVVAEIVGMEIQEETNSETEREVA